MSSFELALPTLFQHEGGFVNNPSDPGGPTKFGISQQFLNSIGTPMDAAAIENMSSETAAEIYRTYFWNRYNYAQINNQDLATKVFDVGVNIGPENAHACLQRAVRAASGVELADDGILGPESLSAINATNSLALLAACKSEMANYYRHIRYSGSQAFLNDWLNRAYSNPISVVA